ncbi:Gfo/Idh/MocA family oxidoreductase [Actinobacillus equuli]|uniref:Gfo/Idh/MocA family oxidoreductase n=1 Tax=Actinobacillus equuli TaxID=718 RepID=UPI002442BE4C|nr:Gfo/Idh/MocA family oxidoreductase [Actinobacillus equuli]WGE46742.1 Gfo/Idh/MocA family oxidoreductase [Actinobacillus equuli subsp. haemolyticus]WGE57296.1 Gfo/Idh/MocA family oxidoreductase [Actinobacillus equuli subsp. equuli]WGE71195.1 Gfo/Idh/MocA family oxidoreductase [Actinobacillus equuli subsp. haemolyticus]WGE81531.1 Gfo/Idh/MocA family oxidoreductase [Actinobacillus equuli subsp. haemolyticus]WGE85755.1 Gfo/Idh/MocA family oxidoreductase [Actinobacillus equuli subsp. haemolyticu
MKVINVALAGAGYSSRVFHVPFFKQDARFQIVKVFERTTNNAQLWLPEVETVRSFDALLSDEVDLVVITTPNQTHYEMVKSALLAGKHVLVEKPLVASAAEALELEQLAKQQNVVLYVYQNRRWDSHIATAKEVLAKNLVGEVVDCEIRFERYAKGKNVKVWKEAGDRGTGLVYDLGVHLIDQAIYLFGKPRAVFADIRYQHNEALVDDNFDLHLYYANGLKVALQASKYAREPSPAFVLHGKNGSYMKQATDSQEAHLSKGVQPIGNWNAEPETEWGVLHTEIDGEVIRKPYPNAQASYQNLVDDLYRVLTAGSEPIVKLEEVTLVLRIIEAAFESANKGQKITL